MIGYNDVLFFYNLGSYNNPYGFRGICLNHFNHYHNYLLISQHSLILDSR